MLPEQCIAFSAYFWGSKAAAAPPVAGADGIKDLLPNSATSSSAREAVNERTSDLPSFSDVGDSLRNALGGNTGDPKDVGRAINQNTPGACRSCVSWPWLPTTDAVGLACGCLPQEGLALHVR